MVNLHNRVFLLSALLLLALAIPAFSTFTYLGSIDGTGTNNNTPYYGFIGPYGLAHDGTYLFVSDDNQNAVYIMSNNTVVKKLGSPGSNVGNYLMPKLLLLKDNNVIVADSGNNRLESYTYSGSLSGVYTVFGGSNNVKVHQPGAVTYLNGQYIATSTLDSQLVLFDGQSQQFSGFYGKQGSYDDGFQSPTGITTANGLVFVSDSGNNRIKVFSSNLTYLYPIGIGKGGIQLSNPLGIYASSDTLYVADSGNNRIVLFTFDGYPIATFGSKGSNSTQFNRPTSVIEQGGVIYVADHDNAVVKMYSYHPDVNSSSLLGQIAAAQANASAVDNISTLAAQILNLSFSPRADVYVRAAQDYYLNNSQLSSYDAASTAIQYAQADMVNFGASVSVELRSRLSIMSDSLVRLENMTYPSDYAPDFNSVDNLLKSVNSKLNAGDYSGALLDYQAASGRINMISSQAISQGGPIAPPNETSNYTTDGNVSLDIRIAQVNASFDALKQLSAQYKQNNSYDDVANYITVANAQLDSGSVLAANASISTAANLISGYSSALQQKIPDINAALKNISAVSAQVEAIGKQGYLIHPDISSAREKIAAATDLAYTSQSGGVTLAAQALADAQSRTNTELYVFGWLALAFLVIVVIVAGTVAFLVVRHVRKRKKGL